MPLLLPKPLKRSAQLQNVRRKVANFQTFREWKTWIPAGHIIVIGAPGSGKNLYTVFLLLKLMQDAERHKEEFHVYHTGSLSEEFGPPVTENIADFIGGLDQYHDGIVVFDEGALTASSDNRTTLAQNIIQHTVQARKSRTAILITQTTASRLHPAVAEHSVVGVKMKAPQRGIWTPETACPGWWDHEIGNLSYQRERARSTDAQLEHKYRQHNGAGGWFLPCKSLTHRLNVWWKVSARPSLAFPWPPIRKAKNDGLQCAHRLFPYSNTGKTQDLAAPRTTQRVLEAQSKAEREAQAVNLEEAIVQMGNDGYKNAEIQAYLKEQRISIPLARIKRIRKTALE